MAAFTYDLSTSLGKTRLFCLDSNRDDFIFSDAELQVFLDTFVGSPMLAAAFALDVIAGDAAKVAVATKNDNQSTDPTKMSELLASRAATLRRQAGSDPVFVASIMAAVETDSPDRIFTTDASPDYVGTMTGW